MLCRLREETMALKMTEYTIYVNINIDIYMDTYFSYSYSIYYRDIDGVLTDTGSNVGATLLIAAGATVAGQSGDAVLARTLTAGAVADLAR